MNKKSMLYEYMWLFIYVFPLIFLLLLAINNPVLDAGNFFVSNGFNILTNGIIYNSLNDLFGVGGILPLFSADNSLALLYSTWFVSVFIVHLCVDFILFIPRLAHKYLNCLGGKND